MNSKRKSEVIETTVEPVAEVEVVEIETNMVPPEKPVEVVKDQIVLSLSEFTETLKGSEVLLASAMKQEFGGEKLTKSAWDGVLKAFGQREV